MSNSNVEEIIAALWAICSILCFGFGFPSFGWAFAIKSLLDTFCAFKAAWNEIAEEELAKKVTSTGGQP